MLQQAAHALASLQLPLAHIISILLQSPAPPLAAWLPAPYLQAVKAKAGEATVVAEQKAEAAKESVQQVAGEVKDSAQRAAEGARDGAPHAVTVLCHVLFRMRR